MDTLRISRQLGDSAITISINPWTKVPDYGPTQAELYQALLERLRTRNIDIPFPQRDVRLVNAPPPGQA